MNRQEWWDCREVSFLRDHLVSTFRYGRTYSLRTSDRKMRLCAVAFLRMVWKGLSHPESQPEVERAEWVAEGKAGPRVWPSLPLGVCHEDPYWSFTNAGTYAQTLGADRQEQCEIVRRIVRLHDFPSWRCEAGHPTLAVSWKHWWRCSECGLMNPLQEEYSPVRRLSEMAYHEREPDGRLRADCLGVLADALEDHGEDFLSTHLRADFPHFRGDWALDYLLGKP